MFSFGHLMKEVYEEVQKPFTQPAPSKEVIAAVEGPSQPSDELKKAFGELAIAPKGKGSAGEFLVPIITTPFLPPGHSIIEEASRPPRLADCEHYKARLLLAREVLLGSQHGGNQTF